MLDRKEVRKSKIAARNALTPEERYEYSRALVLNLIETEEYKSAKTVMIYKYIKGEVQLDYLEELNQTLPQSEQKTLVYPLIISKTEMIALKPKSDESWKKGYFDILEPVEELSEKIRPEDIDLMVCPCTVFDEFCNRMGMGGGFYDRFLPGCKNARILSVAYEVQKADEIPLDPWDHPMDLTVTEKRVYRSK